MIFRQGKSAVISKLKIRKFLERLENEVIYLNFSQTLKSVKKHYKNFFFDFAARSKCGHHKI